MDQAKRAQAVNNTLAMFEKACIVLTQEERQRIEIADFALGDFDRTGLSLLTYINTKLCCAKEMALMPGQTCPEHTHRPMDNGYMGKEETFRCRYGRVHLFVEGPATPNPVGKPPSGDEAYYTAAREIVLNPGDQYTLAPNTLHWFQGGPEGAVISEFSTASHDELDIFTDPRIVR